MSKGIPIIQFIFYYMLPLIVILLSFISIMEFVNYKSFDSEGYKVRFSLTEGCEMLIRNIDDSTEYRGCLNMGDSFTRENYGVKK